MKWERYDQLKQETKNNWNRGQQCDFWTFPTVVQLLMLSNVSLKFPPESILVLCKEFFLPFSLPHSLLLLEFQHLLVEESQCSKLNPENVLKLTPFFVPLYTFSHDVTYSVNLTQRTQHTVQYLCRIRGFSRMLMLLEVTVKGQLGHI